MCVRVERSGGGGGGGDGCTAGFSKECICVGGGVVFGNGTGWARCCSCFCLVFGLRLWTMMQLLWLVGQGKCGEI